MIWDLSEESEQPLPFGLHIPPEKRLVGHPEQPELPLVPQHAFIAHCRRYLVLQQRRCRCVSAGWALIRSHLCLAGDVRAAHLLGGCGAGGAFNRKEGSSICSVSDGRIDLAALYCFL